MNEQEHSAEKLPRFRRDLIASRQESDGALAFVIKDPISGKFFRLREHEYFIARQFDGSAELEAIRRRTEERFECSLGRETLERFVEKLGRLGLFERAQVGAAGPEALRRRIRGSLFYLRFKFFDPDGLFERLMPRVRFLFTPYFAIFSAVMILLGAGISVVNYGDIFSDLSRLWRFDALILVWLTMLAVITAHEFAHGLMCKHYGGRVNEIGFMLIFFQPAFYCNVSDAWLFPEKSKRLWVTFAGAYFEIFLWAAATVVWRITGPETVLNFIALIVMATSGIKTLFNLNPLIKLDGYYLLSDYLGMPNLRPRAFRYLGDKIRRLQGGEVSRPVETTRREKRIYLSYGLVAGIFSVCFLGLIVYRFGGILVERFQGTGFIVLCLMVMSVFQARAKAGASREGRERKLALSLPMALKRRAKPLAALTILAVALFMGRMELKVGGEFEILPEHKTEIRVEIDGIIEEIYVEEGDVVEQGDRIARLAGHDYRAQLQETEAEINKAQAEIRLLRAGASSAEIELAKSEVATARTRVEFAKSRFAEASSMHAEELAKAKAVVQRAEERVNYARKYREMSAALHDRGAISEREMEEAKEQAAVRGNELEEARANLQMLSANDLAEMRRAMAVAEKEQGEAEGRLRLLLAGSRPEKIEAIESERARLEAHRGYLQRQLQQLAVVSPAAGVVTTSKLKEKVGKHLEKGDLLAEVYDLKRVRAEIDIPEKEIADVELGQKVIIKARAFPHKSFYGTVTSIASTAGTSDNDVRAMRTIRVTSELDNSAAFLKPKMTGNAKIYCGERRIAELVSRRIVRYIRVEFWSWW